MKDTANFRPLNDELRNWVEEQLSLLAEYAKSLDVFFEKRLSSESMDDLWIAWKATKTTDSKIVDRFLNCFGIGFGQVLVDDLRFEWTYLEDEYGADIAVRALPSIADTRVAPLHFVLKRWKSDEGRFITDSIAEIDRIVNEHANEHGVER